MSAAAAQAQLERTALAVLPFDNLSDDSEQSYFADGIAEDIITALSRIAGLRVIARNSTFAYKGQAKAYAYLDVLGKAVNAVGKIDHDAIAKYIHKTKFSTVVGDVKFGENGEWTESRTITVQYQNIKNNDLGQFSRAGTRKIMFPADIMTGEVKPFNSLR